MILVVRKGRTTCTVIPGVVTVLLGCTAQRHVITAKSRIKFNTHSETKCTPRLETFRHALFNHHLHPYPYCDTLSIAWIQRHYLSLTLQKTPLFNIYRQHCPPFVLSIHPASWCTFQRPARSLLAWQCWCSRTRWPVNTSLSPDT